MSDRKIANPPEHPFLIIGTGEAKRTVEDPDFDFHAYEEDRLLFIKRGMRTAAGRNESGPGAAEPVL